MKKSLFESAIASGMDSIIRDEQFNSIFKKASSVKIAEDINCGHDCADQHDHSHKCDDSCNDMKMANDLSVEAAVKQVVQNLSKISEILDNVGLEKTAALSLNLAANIVVEAKKAKNKKDMDKSDKKDIAKSDKKDMGKSEKKSDKKDADKSDKKSDKSEKNPFAKKDSDKNPFAKKDKKEDKSDSKKK